MKNPFTSEAIETMPVSLNTLLHTHPYKRKDYLESICAKLQLSTKGTADTLRQRIVIFVENNDEMDEKIEEYAYHLKHTDDKEFKEERGMKPTTHELP